MELRSTKNLTTVHDLNSPLAGVPTSALTPLLSSLNLSSQSASVKMEIRSSYPFQNFPLVSVLHLNSAALYDVAPLSSDLTYQLPLPSQLHLRTYQILPKTQCLTSLSFSKCHFLNKVTLFQSTSHYAFFF